MLSLRTRLISAIRMYSTEMSAHNEVLFEVKNDVGIITLNRPKVLNSLNENMVNAIHSKLKEWERERSMIIVKGAGDKAFCAGGDVVAATKDKNAGKSFFRQEYKMNYLIGTYRTPYISILDGFVMGGGVGISVHGKYRIATERTLFAMPETAIGLFPDVGGSYFLPRLQMNLGLFLGLTGHRLQGPDVVNAGIATHFVLSKNLPKFMDKLMEADPYCLDDFLRANTEDVKDRPMHLTNHLELIEAYFASPSVVDIMTVLYHDSFPWAYDVAAMMQKNSPTSLFITFLQLNLGRNMTLDECLKMEYRLACAALDRKLTSDFYEGVRAQLIDKDKSPKWNPDHINDVVPELIPKVFEHLPASEELEL